ncbi:MAG: hypothetical protein HOC71_08525 [Candidatus Latescibacteria bacterium]|jgi:uncharacterized protein YjbI with pentapeptide repeats|nr:hypothetical protein [Candidatus Latescibacterota bacterium]
MPKQNEEMVNLLIDIKEGKTPATSKPLDLRGISLTGLDLSSMDLSGVDFSGADLTGSNLSGTNLFKAKLKQAILINANLKSAELSGADLTGAFMEEVNASRAGLGMACLKSANLFRANLEGSTLSMTNFEKADLRGVSLRNSRIREAKIIDADLTNADLRGADMALCDVTGTTFNNADMRETRLRSISGFMKAKWIGVDVRNVNFSGAYLLRRFIMDQNYIKEFRQTSRLSAILYYLWWLTSDCGRSLLRWCICITLLAFFFGGLYTFVGIDYGDYPTIISPLYYSVVTLTTLGYGDVVPATFAAQIIAMIEVISGYIMLGGLLSIFNNKIARRAD